ncbi:Acetyltransferase (GNAT) family protein [compost metagenome]
MEATHCQKEEIRICAEADLDAIMQLQEAVCSTLDNPEIFAATSREENAGYLREPNIILGAFIGNQLVAYCSLAFPGTAEDNLAWDLGWPAERVVICAKLDTVIVDPAFRGRGLQRILVRQTSELAEVRQHGVYLLTTVSPHNPHSLRNMQAEGFQILLKKEKYGGLERYILGKQLQTGS